MQEKHIFFSLILTKAELLALTYEDIDLLADVELTKVEERTLIWLGGWEESTVDHLLLVIEKAARIRADKKGGYAHKSKCEFEK